MLKMVVLPAPFGPIRPLMSPSGISNDASCTARRPRNDLLMPRTSSSATAFPSHQQRYDGCDRDDPERRINDEQVDADVAIAAAGDLRLVQRLERRVKGPGDRRDERWDAPVPGEAGGEDCRRNESAQRPFDEWRERLEND